MHSRKELYTSHSNLQVFSNTDNEKAFNKHFPNTYNFANHFHEWNL